MRRRHDRSLATFDLRQPWILSLTMIALIPLFPEYIAPFLSVFAFLFAMTDVKRHHRHVRVGPCGNIMLVFLVFMTIHLFWATDRGLSLLSLAYWIAMLLTYLALSSILISPRRIETALFLLSVVVGAVGFIACAQYVLVGILHIEEVPLQIWDFVDERVYGLVDMNISLHSLGVRAGSTFSNPNLYAQFTVMAIPFVASYGFSGERSAAKIIARLSLLFAVMGVFFSFSRGSYLALAAIAIVMCVANIRRVIPMLIVAMSGFLLLPDSIWSRLLSIGDASDVAITERFQVWGVTMQVFLDRPVAGHGIGLGGIWPRLAECGFTAPHAHNTFLEFLVEGGIIGLLLLLFLLWKLFRTGFELIIHTPKTRMYGASIIAFCGGFCLGGMFDFPLFTPKLIGMFMMVLAFTDCFGSMYMKHEPATLASSLPFYQPLRNRAEQWVKQKTAPKE